MASRDIALAPQENLGLLSAIARADRVKRTETRKLDDAKRDIVAALKGCELLLPLDGDRPAAAPAGPDGGDVLAVCTDSEAADAWRIARHPASPPATVALSAELEEGPTDWLELCRRHGISALAVNPAGPLGAMVYVDELERLRPRLLHRPPAPDPELIWLDLDHRAAERARAAEMMARLARAIDAGDTAAANAAASESGPINRLRSLFIGAELHRLGGRLRVHDRTWDSGLQELAVASTQFRLAGEPHHATDTLLETAAGLRTLIADGDTAQREWAATRLAQVHESLQLLAVTGYRREDLQRLAPPETGEP